MSDSNNDYHHSTTIEAIEASAGIKISKNWLDAYLQFKNSGDQEIINNDVILHQILQSDLRNVVNRSRTESTTSTLQKAVIDSLPNPDNTTNTDNSITDRNIQKLKNIKILIQVEELLDISQNAETRLQHGPTSSNAPKPVGNQSNRCLKMMISDGYLNKTPLVAMETSPIPDLSVNSKPGIKVLLQGEICIRFGIIMLHQGNAVVLGGEIRALIHIQKKALELARKVAGVGVDPTIKALIPDRDEITEEENDEAEHASGDVQARQQQTFERFGNAPRNNSSNTSSSLSAVQDMPPPPALLPRSLQTETINQIFYSQIPSQQASATVRNTSQTPAASSTQNSSSSIKTPMTAPKNNNSFTPASASLSNTVPRNPYKSIKSKKQAKISAFTKPKTSISTSAAAAINETNNFSASSISNSKTQTKSFPNAQTNSESRNYQAYSSNNSTSQQNHSIDSASSSNQSTTNNNHGTINSVRRNDTINPYATRNISNGYKKSFANNVNETKNHPQSYPSTNSSNKNSNESIETERSSLTKNHMQDKISINGRENSPKLNYNVNDAPSLDEPDLGNEETISRETRPKETLSVTQIYKVVDCIDLTEDNSPQIPKKNSPNDCNITVAEEDTNVNLTKEEEAEVVIEEIEQTAEVVSNDQCNDYSLLSHSSKKNLEQEFLHAYSTTPEEEQSTSTSTTTHTTPLRNSAEKQILHPFSTETHDNATAEKNLSMAFSEFLLHLKTINEASFKLSQGTLFKVRCMLKRTKTIEFNIQKIKKSKRTSTNSVSKEYEYIFICEFGIENLDEVVRCKICNFLLVPFFGISASEISKMRKTEKRKVDKLTKEAGNKVLDEFSNLQLFHFKLNPAAYKQSNEKRGKEPIVLLVGRENEPA